MNLYRLDFTHCAPKGSADGIKGFYLARNIDELLEKIEDETYWEDYLKDSNKDYILEGTDKWVSFKEILIANKGYSFLEKGDYYYGQSYHSWELLKEDISEEEVMILVNLGIDLN